MTVSVCTHGEQQQSKEGVKRTVGIGNEGHHSLDTIPSSKIEKCAVNVTAKRSTLC